MCVRACVRACVCVCVSSLVYRLLLSAIKTKVSKDIIYKEKISVYNIVFSCQLMKPFLPPEWSSGGYLHLSSRNRLLENNLPVVSLAYHLIPLVIYFELYM